MITRNFFHQKSREVIVIVHITSEGISCGEFCKFNTCVKHVFLVVNLVTSIRFVPDS